MFPILDHCEHLDYAECRNCTNERHNEAHPVRVEGCGICRLSNGSIQISPQATPSKREGRRFLGPPPKKPNNSWERGIATDERGMPLFMDGKPVSVKRYAERRHEIEDKRRRLHTDPHVFDVPRS